MKTIRFWLLAVILSLCFLIGWNLAWADEWTDYKEWSFVNHNLLIEKYNHGESFGSYLVPEKFKPMIIQECFGYTDYENLINKWQDKRAPKGIYAYYLKHRENLWNRIDNQFITVE